MHVRACMRVQVHACAALVRCTQVVSEDEPVDLLDTSKATKTGPRRPTVARLRSAEDMLTLLEGVSRRHPTCSGRHSVLAIDVYLEAPLPPGTLPSGTLNIVSLAGAEKAVRVQQGGGPRFPVTPAPLSTLAVCPLRIGPGTGRHRTRTCVHI